MEDGNQKTRASGEKPLTGLEAYQRAGGRVSLSSDGLSTAQSLSSSIGITKEEDIVWAPEDPDEAIDGELEELWKSPESVTWHLSHKEAMRYARESGKPVLIWFTDSVRSALCKALNNELFSSDAFNSWATDKVVRVRIDAAIPGSRSGENDWTQKRKAIEKLKKNYRVHGHPTVILLSPNGRSIDQYRGYKKGNPDYYWGRIKGAVTQAESDYGAWREKLEKRGYRMWTNRKGRKTFSKLYRFTGENITLIDPEGKRGTTSFNKLSDADQTWVLQEKQKYDQQRGQ